MAEELTEDLIVEILCRLPVRSLMGFKTVSKGWYNLISNVCAPKISRSSAIVPSGFLFMSMVGNKSSSVDMGYASYPEGDYSDSRTAGLVKSCRKLLPVRKSCFLLDCRCGFLLFAARDFQYYVCNPATKQCIVVPNVQQKDESYTASLVFENCTTLPYKIVRFLNLRCCSASNPLKLEIFSSATGKWVVHKVNSERSDLRKVAWADRTVYLDGKLYKQTLSEYLLCFDLSKFTAQAIMLPLTNISYRFGFIGLSKGHFYYANHDSSKSNICIWLLNNSCGNHYFWTLRHCISIPDLMSSNHDVRNLCKGRISSNCMPYAIHPSADVIFLGFPSMLLSYNLEDGKLEVLFKMRRGRTIRSGQCRLFSYSPSYVVLNDFSKDPPESSLF